MLSHPPFAANPRIRAASRNDPPLTWGSAGRAVALVQAAFVDLGFSMPRSIRPNGLPDGIYGNETFEVVKRFQARNSLVEDGIVGKATIARLDTLMSGTKKPPAPAPPKGVPPGTKHYEIGTSDPPIHPDPGAGVWRSTPPTLTATLMKSAIAEVLPIAELTIGEDAVKQLRHYFGNTGKPYTIDLEQMVADVPTAKKIFHAEVAQAKTLADRLPPGVFSITSKLLSGGYNYKSESQNWYFAIGGYSVWGKGTVIVNGDPPGRDYEMNFQYHFYDRYNWDQGKKVTIGGIDITDEFMGEFHRQGMAREYDAIGTIERTFTWRWGHPIAPRQFLPSAPGLYVP